MREKLEGRVGCGSYSRLLMGRVVAGGRRAPVVLAVWTVASVGDLDLVEALPSLWRLWG